MLGRCGACAGRRAALVVLCLLVRLLGGSARGAAAWRQRCCRSVRLHGAPHDVRKVCVNAHRARELQRGRQGRAAGRCVGPVDGHNSSAKGLVLAELDGNLQWRIALHGPRDLQPYIRVARMRTPHGRCSEGAGNNRCTRLSEIQTGMLQGAASFWQCVTPGCAFINVA